MKLIIYLVLIFQIVLSTERENFKKEINDNEIPITQCIIPIKENLEIIYITPKNIFFRDCIIAELSNNEKETLKKIDKVLGEIEFKKKEIGISPNKKTSFQIINLISLVNKLIN